MAKLVKNNKLTPVQIELVCIVSYEETEKKSGSNETELKQCVENIVYERLTDFDKTFFNNKCAVTLDRLHLIVMPIWDFRDLLRDFEE